MYNVQQKTQSTIARQARIGFAILGIATIFVTCFLMTQAIMTAVYGLPSSLPLEATGSAYIGLGASSAAAASTTLEDSTQGQMIDSYVQNIKEQVCPTIDNNITALQECYNF